MKYLNKIMNYKFDDTFETMGDIYMDRGCVREKGGNWGREGPRERGGGGR